MEEQKCCGNCKWHKKASESEDWFCDNYDGEYYCDFTHYDTRCPDWEERT